MSAISRPIAVSKAESRTVIIPPKGLSVNPAVSAVAARALSVTVGFKVQIEPDQWFPSDGWAEIEVLNADASESVNRIQMINYENAYWCVKTTLPLGTKFIVSYAYPDAEGHVCLMRETGGFREVTEPGEYYLRRPVF